MFELNCETDWLVYADYLGEGGDFLAEGQVREDICSQTNFWSKEADSRPFEVGGFPKLKFGIHGFIGGVGVVVRVGTAGASRNGEVGGNLFERDDE